MNAVTNGQSGELQMTASRALFVNLRSSTGFELATSASPLSVSVTNTNANGQVTMANSSPVVLPSNQSVGDPCTFQTKTSTPISTAAGTFPVVQGVASERIYICAMTLVASPLTSVSLAEGSSANCGTSNQAGVMGVGTNGTAANGMPIPTGGILPLGSGAGTLASTATAANYLCLFQSGTSRLSGNLTFVQQ